MTFEGMLLLPHLETILVVFVWALTLFFCIQSTCNYMKVLEKFVTGLFLSSHIDKKLSIDTGAIKINCLADMRAAPGLFVGQNLVLNQIRPAKIAVVKNIYDPAAVIKFNYHELNVTWTTVLLIFINIVLN